MRSVHETPTEPIDYAALTAVYGSLLGALLVAARDRGDTAVRSEELPAIGLATFALSKLLAREKIDTWVREPFVDGETRRPKGRRLRYAVGELLTCSRCLGAWSSLGLVALRLTRPREAHVITSVLATSALNDFLQAGFSALAAQANALERDAAAPLSPETTRRSAGPAAHPARSARTA
jgi:hypothetical protein